MERLTIQTHNFKSKDNQLDHLKSAFGHALSRGPSDASLCCCISKEKKEYVLNMRIHSCHGHFPIHAQHKDFQTLIEYVLGIMQKSFQEWHNDPDQYGELHPMGTKSCYHADGSTYKCPLGLYSNKKFEEQTNCK